MTIWETSITSENTASISLGFRANGQLVSDDMADWGEAADSEATSQDKMRGG